MKVVFYCKMYFEILEFGGLGADSQSTFKVSTYPDGQAINSFEMNAGEALQVIVKDNNPVDAILVPRFTYSVVSMNKWFNVNLETT